MSDVIEAKRNAAALPLRASAFAPLALLPILPLALLHQIPPWAFMWLMAFALFLGFKWLTYATSTAPAAPLRTQLLYLVAWPGLAPDEFTRPLPEPHRPSRTDWLAPMRHVLIGLALVTFVAPRISHPLARGWAGMVGLILLLHFGSFHLLALAYRSIGLDARPIMLQPLRSNSLADFWGRRWNTAFAALADRHLFRPLARRIGPPAALATVFVVSGILHEAVITLPAGGGYGLPTLFFSVQAGGLLLERHPAIAAHPVRRRVLAWILLLGPVGCLFPSVFVEQVILPMLDLIEPIP